MSALPVPRTDARLRVSRALPIRVEPLADEAFDGYLEYVAHKLYRDPRDLLAQLRLPDRDETPYRLVRSFSGADTEVICRTFNITPDQLHSMTLARWRNLGLMPPRTERRGNFAGAWPRGAGARYCPLCLRERDYRVRLTDRCQHVYVCPEHDVWLETLCPVCNRPPRSRGRFYPRSPPTTSARSLSCPVGCASEVLAAVDPAPAPARFVRDHEVVLRLLDGRSLDVWQGRLPAALAFLDLASLSRLAIASLGRQNCDPELQLPGVELDLDVREALVALPDTHGTPRLARAVENVRVGAYALTVALHVLSADDEAQARERLRWVPAIPSKSRSQSEASPISAQLTRVLQVCLPGQRTPRRLAVGLLRASSNVIAVRPGSLDPSMLPATLWPEAVAALPGNLQLHPWYGRSLMSMFLLGIGARRPWPEVSLDLGLSLLAGLTARHLRTLVRELSVQEGTVELLGLFRLLREHRPPIDYSRRRSLFTARLQLGRNQLKVVARANQEPLTQTFARRCTWHLHEVLTGGDATLGGYTEETYGPRRRLFMQWKAGLSGEAQHEFRKLAETQLKRHRLPEPIDWTPEHQQGQWTAPPPDLTRLLGGWDALHLREGSRTGAKSISLHALVRSAASGTDTRSRLRLERFLLLPLADHNITTAAALAGSDQATYSKQLQILEQHAGGSVLVRSERKCPGQLTPLGRELVQLAGTYGLRPARPPGLDDQ